MNFLVLIVFLLFAARRLLTYLHIYQQEEYDSLRFIRWLVAQRSFDKRATLGIFVIGLAQMFGGFSGRLAAILAAIVLLLVALVEKDPRFAGKKPLAMTDRAKRIYIAASLFVDSRCACDLPIVKPCNRMDHCHPIRPFRSVGGKFGFNAKRNCCSEALLV